MSNLPTGNAIVAQSGGPSAVINQSLVGVVESLRGKSNIKKILGARHGVKGMTTGQITDLTGVSAETLEAVARTPSSALGSTRDKPDRAYCERVLEALKQNDVRYFFYIGGNDSSDTCRIVSEMARSTGYELRAFHVPKTIDNDLMENDHTPGFASAARYVAMSFMGDSLDNRALPGIKLNVVMGRHAGFLTAASALARVRDDDGPHFIYVPEVPLSLDRFVADVDRVYNKLGRCHIAVSEGVNDEKGESIGASLIKGEADAHGNAQLSGSGALGDQLIELLKKRLTPAGGKAPRARADTLGYAQRYWPDPSPVDSREAREVGRHAVACALKVEVTDGSICIKRASKAGEPYRSEIGLVRLDQVAAKTRHLPAEFIAAGGGNVTAAFVEWCRPLVGELPKVGWL
ncbi:MAG: 6-phosphofructokinase [Phycisphaerales bacterium]